MPVSTVPEEDARSGRGDARRAGRVEVPAAQIAEALGR
jgi:hypothetical protein